MISVHVTPNGEFWSVKVSNEFGQRSQFKTKGEAVANGTALAKALKCELIVHGLDGKIQYRNSYGNDPFPPRG